MRHRPRPRRLRDPALGPHLHQLPDALRLAARRRRRSRAPTSGCRRSRPTPTSSGTTGSATSTRISTRDRTLVGAVRGRRGARQRRGPDHRAADSRRAPAARPAGFAAGVSLEAAVRGRVVMVTGASSGIGTLGGAEDRRRGRDRAARRPHAPRSSRRPRRRSRPAAARRYVHACDLSDMDDIDRMADEALAQHGHVDVLVNNAGRSIRRSIALSYDRFHDFERTMQLNYFGAVKLILKLLPVMRERALGPDRQRQLDRRADEHAALLRLRGVEGRARRVLALHRVGDHRRRGARSRRSTCRWCGRR